jgi:hypothetical protein
MGLKVKKQNKIIHFFLIKVIKTYNDKKRLEKSFGFLDIPHINKQKIKLHSKQTYDKIQKNITRIKHNINLKQIYVMKIK